MKKRIVSILLIATTFNTWATPIGFALGSMSSDGKFQYGPDKEGHAHCYEINDHRYGNGRRVYRIQNMRFCKEMRDFEDGHKLLSKIPTYKMIDNTGKCWEVDTETSGEMFKNRKYGIQCLFVSAPKSYFSVEEREIYLGLATEAQCIQRDSKTRGKLYENNVDMDLCNRWNNTFKLIGEKCFEVDALDQEARYKVKVDRDKCPRENELNINDSSRGSRGISTSETINNNGSRAIIP